MGDKWKFLDKDMAIKDIQVLLRPIWEDSTFVGLDEVCLVEKLREFRSCQMMHSQKKYSFLGQSFGVVLKKLP